MILEKTQINIAAVNDREIPAVSTPLGAELAELGLLVRDDLYVRRVYGRDLWPRNLLLARDGDPYGQGEDVPKVQAVVWPKSIEELQSLVRWANEKPASLFPRGAGSGVCGGATVDNHDTVTSLNAEQVSEPVASSSPVSSRPAVIVDLKQMDRIEWIDEVSLVAKVQAGIMGQVLEEDLNAKGYTMGHFPSSIYCSSFGGYLATRAAGQCSTYYGKMEDIVYSIEGVLPDGTFFRTPSAPKLSIGPDWTQTFLGSEGSLAFLTAAIVKIHPVPKTRSFMAWQVASTEEALNGIRLWVQAGYRPAVVRLYDEDESRMLHGFKEGVKLIAIVEGETDFVTFATTGMKSVSEASQKWKYLGEEPAQHWFHHRYDVSYHQQQILSHSRMILDTFEVAGFWTNLPTLHKRVREVMKEIREVPELKSSMLILVAHFSHFYHSGGMIYFSLCGRTPENVKSAHFYDQVWERLLEACLEVGGGVSHHHGVGRLKVAAMKSQQGALFDVLKKLKSNVDPKNILNPQNLGL